ncbi:MAG: PQQ-binding-like beta-propeller repeat protein [Firmicutes bacterium]|nr:PQQ-binding-like beta-propeller repeat protein [Bacillota bacterium]
MVDYTDKSGNNPARNNDLLDFGKEKQASKYKILWSWQSTGKTGFTGNPVLAPTGLIFIKDGSNRIYIIDSKNGVLKNTIDERREFTAPVVSDYEGNLIAGDRQGYVHSIEPVSGQENWAHKITTFSISSKPELVNGNAICVGENTLFSLNCKSGEKQWEYVTGNHIQGHPVIGCAGSIYIISCDGTLRAMDAITGIHKYEIRIDNPHKCTNIAVSREQTLYFGNNQSRKIQAFECSTGKVKWETDFKGVITSPVVDRNNNILYSCSDGKTYYLNGSNGKKLWDVNPGLTTASLARKPYVTESGHILISGQGKILIINRDNGEIIQEITTGKAVPHFHYKQNVLITTDYDKIAVGELKL